MIERQVVEVRCPSGPRTLLMKLQQDPNAQKPETRDNFLVLACRDCTRKHRKEMERAGLGTNFRVVHLFDFAGDFVESQREAL